MRIGYIYDLKAYPPKGGNHRHTYELVQGFINAGHSVCVVDDPTMPGVTNYSGYFTELKTFLQNIDVLYVRIDSRFTSKWKTLNTCTDISSGIPIVWEINSPSDEDLAFSWLGGAITASSRESFIRRLKRRIHAARKIPSITREERHRRKLARSVDHAICVSEAVGKYASQDLHIKNIHVLPNAGPIISEEEIQLRRNKRRRGEFTVLYCGSAIYPWQGLNILTEVIRQANNASLDIKFILAVNQKTDLLPDGDNVEILESLDQEQVHDLICTSDICVALIPEWHWTRFGFHGSPTKIFEYMALMTPVMTSNHGQMKEILRDGQDAILCNNDPDEIVHRLIALKNTPELTAEIGRNGWQRINTELNWENNAGSTIAIFEKALTKDH